jgi:kynurenine formamidase
MKKYIDISGRLCNGMWHYEEPFPRIHIHPLPDAAWAGKIYSELMDGVCSQTGTYLETPAHYYGYERSYLLGDVPLDRLIDIPCVVLDLGPMDMEPSRRPVTRDMLERCSGAALIRPGDAIFVCCGWDRYWMDERFVSASPYFKHDAMMWLIDQKPFLLGGDSPRWENLEQPEGFFDAFFSADILMLAPCVNLSAAAGRGRLTALPLNVPDTCAAPCRAVIAVE